MSELTFSAEIWQCLTAHQRVQYCRLMAREMRALALTGRMQASEFYFELAERWAEFAEALEVQGGGP